MPEAAIMPYSRKLIPPITGPGIVFIKALTLPKNARKIENTAAPQITHTLYTLVTAITPMFSPYVVVGTEPQKPESIVERPSASIDLWFS